MVIALGVSDKFGDNGITGLAIIRIQNDLADIDTLLLSCRIIGRRIEYRFFDFLVDFLLEKGVNTIQAEYIKSLKNDQVKDLFNNLGFEMVGQLEDTTKYRIDIHNYKNHQINYMNLI